MNLLSHSGLIMTYLVESFKYFDCQVDDQVMTTMLNPIINNCKMSFLIYFNVGNVHLYYKFSPGTSQLGNVCTTTSL